jgi:hypothetical protein
MPRAALTLVALVLVVASTGCQTVRGAWDLATGNTALVNVARMEDADSPDQRRRGINYLVARDYGTRPPYTTRYAEIAANDPDFVVRATAVRALNRARDADATPVFIKALADESAVVRLEAAKALANVPDPAAAPALIGVINNPEEPKDVRIAAADALRHYRDIEVARTLVAQLNVRDFGVAWQSRRSLEHMTGKAGLRYDEGAWLAYLTGPGKPFG